MYLRLHPHRDLLQQFIAAQSGRPVFQESAEIPDPPPAGFYANRGSGAVGRGQTAFLLARSAVQQWRMFPVDWVQVESGGVPVHVGQTVAVVARCLGIWTANCCRVVDVTDGEREYAFTYATTDQHALAGAERFHLEWRADDTVWFSIHAVARPRDWVVWLAYPQLRRLQRRFAVESPAALRRAITAAKGSSTEGNEVNEGPQ